MSKYKNFDIQKATDKISSLSESYKSISDLYEAKCYLINQLIYAQEHSKQSIVNTTIEIEYWFPKKIIEEILDDLGYKLISYSIGYACPRNKFTRISFILKEPITAEG